MRTRRTSTYTAAKTETVTAEAKAYNGTANAPTFAERRAARKNGASAYTAENSETVLVSTAVKGGAAALTDAVATVGETYKESGVKFGKLALADKAVKEAMALLPTSGTKAFFKKLPLIGKYIENREEAAIKGILVTIVPVALAHFAETVENVKVATVMDEVANTLIDMGARDGIEASTNFLSPKLKSLYDTVMAIGSTDDVNTTEA